MKHTRDELQNFYAKIYHRLDQVTPLVTDCGAFCGQACCQADNTSLGIYLLPGEEVMFSGKEAWLVWERHNPREYDFPPTWTDPVYFVRCRPPCPRQCRPLQCRSFPLAPHLLPDGKLVLIWETLHLPYICPLIAKKMPLRQDFVLALGQAWQELVSCRPIRDLVAWDSRPRSQIEIVLMVG